MRRGVVTDEKVPAAGFWLFCESDTHPYLFLGADSVATPALAGAVNDRDLEAAGCGEALS